MIESKNSILHFWDPLLSLNPPSLTTNSNSTEFGVMIIGVEESFSKVQVGGNI